MRNRAWLVAFAASLLLAQPARAQCSSNASSCVSCHEAKGLRPVLQDLRPWHADHAFGDLCAACHGGNPGAPTQVEAHAGLRAPLVDPTGSCAGCHEDAGRCAESYLASAPPPGDADVSSMSSPAGPNSTPPSAGPSSTPAGAPGPSRANLVLGACSLLLAAATFAVLRRRRGAATTGLVAWLRAPSWSPYVAGVLLGVVVAVSEVFCGRPLAASGAFDKLAAYAGVWLFPKSPYYGHLMSPGITWQVWLLVGVLGGGFASSRLAGTARLRFLPDEQWVPRFGPSRLLRLALAFGGAVLVQLGAAIAGGCTSGLAISGGTVLAPGAFVFMAGMFAGGIPTAWLWYRGRHSS